MFPIDRIKENERKYVNEVLDDAFRTSCGYKMTRRLEEAFAEKFGSRYAVAFCNGTATLHIALEAAGVGMGDEVIVPPLTMSSTTFGVLHTGATPVFADVDPDTFLITAEAIERCITPRTRAIIAVSLYGLSPDMDPIMALAKKHDLTVIEDDAQCFLGKYKGKTVGTLGDMASFSFQASKHMTSGEGGMLITDSEELAAKIRQYSGLGYAGITPSKGKISKNDIQNPNYSRHVSLGWNYRMSDVASAVALGQLEHLDELVEARIACAKRFDEAISGTSLLARQKEGKEYVNSYWAYTVKLTDDCITWADFREKFIAFGGDSVYAAWKLTYLEPMFLDKVFLGREALLNDSVSYEKGICPVAEKLQGRLLQFKTNYYDADELEAAAQALEKTVAYFK